MAYPKVYINFFVCVVFILCTAGRLMAQQDNPARHKAEEYYERGMKAIYSNDQKKAIENFYNSIDAFPGWPKPYYVLGDIYEQQHQDSDALEVYKKLLVQVPDDFDGRMGKARTEVALHRFTDAQDDYEQAAAIKDVPPKYHKVALDKVDNMKYILSLVSHPVPFDPVNLGPEVNSDQDEYFPTFTVDGETMYFTRRKLRGTREVNGMTFSNYNEDIMMSHKVNGKWTKAEDIPGPINTPDNNEGAMCIAPDGSYLIFTKCIRDNCDLYISFYIDGNWTNPVNMGEPVNTRFNEKQACISADGRTIYFASNRPGTLGGLDIWTSTRDNNWNFGQPVNLGPAINTSQDDQFPFIHTDNQTLYFISVGRKGMGKNDIYYSRRNPQTGQWDSAVNIGYPINTPDDEPGLVIDRLGEYGYFSSERPGGYGDLDLYRFKIPKEARPKQVTYLKAHVQDINTKSPLEADLELVDLETGKSFLKTTCTKAGDVEAVLPGGKDYMVNVSDSGYLFYSDNIPLKNYHNIDPYLLTIELKPIKAGEKINLRNVFFPTDGFTLEDKSKSELNKLAAFLVAKPTVKLEVEGHTDNTGSKVHNQELSEKRAKAVYDYLVNDQKIPASRLSYKGYGDTQPLAPNTTEKGKAQNRRTEVKILE